MKAAKEDTSAPGPSNVVINEKTSMSAVTKIQVFKLYYVLLLLPLTVLLLLSKPPKNIKTRLIRLKHLKRKKEKNKTTTNEQKQVRCPSCGGTDRSRSSRKLCPMNKSKTKLPKPKDTVEKTFVIKTF